MRIHLLLVLAYLSAFSIHATPTEPLASSDNKTLESNKQQPIKQQANKTSPQVPSEKVDVLANQICAYYTSNASKVAENVKRSVINHMKKYEKISNPTPTQMVTFLNRNKHYMTCGDDDTGYMVESFRHGAYDQLFNVFMFDYLLLDDESLFVDINAISYTAGKENTQSGPGKPELTLDYMDRESINPANADRMRKEIKDLIEFFEGDLGGKRYHELTEQEKQATIKAKNYNDNH
ncbi:hypothetical protein [Colwellia sp. KU-HH00111]|uniref:hypothetical protein n=1 Tax=Colwellia sp. KU-HH00111 TaxID=3127652 RepID=UPI0033659B67